MSISDVEHCDVVHKHADVVLKVHREMPDDDKLYDLAELFKVFGDSTRIRILFALFEEEMCVCDIAASVGITVSAVSHQLRILKGAKLVKARKDGKSVFYTLADNHVKLILAQGMEHVTE